MPFAATPWLDDLGGDDVHEHLGEAAAFGIALKVIGRLIPPEIRVKNHRQKQIVAIVHDDDLPARTFDRRVVDQILLGAVCADVTLERELTRDDLLDRDFLFPAVSAVPLLAPRFGYVLRPAQYTLRLDEIRLSGR